MFAITAHVIHFLRVTGVTSKCHLPQLHRAEQAGGQEFVETVTPWRNRWEQRVM